MHGIEANHPNGSYGVIREKVGLTVHVGDLALHAVSFVDAEMDTWYREPGYVKVERPLVWDPEEIGFHAR